MTRRSADFPSSSRLFAATLQLLWWTGAAALLIGRREPVPISRDMKRKLTSTHRIRAADA
jgi:hypothetical protein